MRYIVLTVAMIVLCLSSYAQSTSSAFETDKNQVVPEIIMGPSSSDIDLSDHFIHYEVIKVDVLKLRQSILNSRDGNLSLNIADRLSYEAAIYPDPIRSPSYNLVVPNDPEILATISSRNKRNAVSRGNEVFISSGEVKTFNGYTEDNHEIRMTIDTDFLFIEIITPESNYFIEKGTRFDSNFESNEYILYKRGDIVSNSNVSCGAKDIDLKKEELNQDNRERDTYRMGCVEVELAVAHTKEMLAILGSVNNCENHAIAVMNSVNGDYDDAFTNEVKFVITEQVVWNSNTEPTSITNATSITPYLNAFTAWAPTGFNLTHDLGQLWFDTGITSGVIGLAWVGVVCGNARYHVLENYTINSQSLRVLTSHEIGHNFNCLHNYDPGQGCSRDPLIMDPSVNVNAVAWSNGTQNCAMNSIASVNNHVASRSCLEDCTVGPPATNFTSSSTETCTGQSISFSDNTLGSPTSWSWSFPGGTPSTSTLEDPTVTYNSPGTYNVILTATNASGSTTETKTNYIQVNDGEGPYTCTPSGNPGTAGLRALQINNADDTEVFHQLVNGIANEDGSKYVDNTCTKLEIESGETYTFKFFNNTCASQQGPFSYFRIYIDFDGDGVLETSGSIDLFSTSGSSSSCGGSFPIQVAIPSDAVINQPLRMRAIAGSGQFFSTDPCQDPGNGQTEDFTIIVREPVATSAGCQSVTVNNVSGTSWFPIRLNNNLVAEINPNGQNLGNLTIELNDNPSVPMWAGTRFVPRNWNITSTIAPVSDLSVRLYVLDQELTDLNLADGTNLEAEDLVVNYYSSSSEDCDLTNNGGAGTVIATITDYDFFDTEAFYVQFDIDHFTEFGLASEAVLPVEWISFDAKKRGSDIDLEWQTATEINNDHFSIERSWDGIHFSEIGVLSGNGTSSNINSYSFTDYAVKRSAYYRVKQVDYDDQSSLTETRYVQVDEDQLFSVFPVPLQANGQLYIQSPAEGKHDIELYGLDGRKRLAKELIFNNYDNQKINLSHLPTGIYLIRVTPENGDPMVSKITIE